MSVRHPSVRAKSLPLSTVCDSGDVLADRASQLLRDLTLWEPRAGVGITMLGRRWSDATTLREVYRLEDVFIFKRFVVHGSWFWAKKPWRNEHGVLSLLAGERLAPRTFGYLEFAEKNRKIALYLKEYLPGHRLHRPEPEDLLALATLYAHLHRAGVVPFDPAAHNFIRREDGSVGLVDFDGAKRAEFLSRRFMFYASREFHRLYRSLFCSQPEQYETFVQLYWQAVGAVRSGRRKQFDQMIQYWASKEQRFTCS